jgi:hypothetical protein
MHSTNSKAKRKPIIFAAITFFLLAFITIIYLASNHHELSARGKELVPNTQSYLNIAEYATAHLRTDEFSTSIPNRYTVSLKDISNINEIASDVAVAMQDYSYFWIEDYYIVFWNDETGTEAILCTLGSAEALKTFKSKFNDRQIEELGNDCYLVRPRRAWIG